MIVELEKDTNENCVFCGNEEYKMGLCRHCYELHKWLEEFFSCVDGKRAYELIENPEYSDYYFSPRETKTKAQAMVGLYRQLADLERKEFLKEIKEDK